MHQYLILHVPFFPGDLATLIGRICAAKSLIHIFTTKPYKTTLIFTTARIRKDEKIIIVDASDVRAFSFHCRL